MVTRKPQSKAARNERRKAIAATLNALGVALLAAAFFQPIATGRAPKISLSLVAILVFIALQAIAHYMLSRLED